MRSYEQLKELNPPDFKRACGVSRGTFYTMVEVLQPHLERQGKRGGQNSLSVQDQLLITMQKGAGISHAVSHRSRFWSFRIHGLSNHRKGGNATGAIRALSTAREAVTTTTGL